MQFALDGWICLRFQFVIKATFTQTLSIICACLVNVYTSVHFEPWPELTSCTLALSGLMVKMVCILHISEMCIYYTLCAVE